jgi:hypothetical protein
VTCERDEVYAGAFRVGADPSSHFIAIKARKLEIDQRDVGFHRENEVQAFDAVGCGFHPVAVEHE